MCVKVIIPMTGLGRRFAGSRFGPIKPLIEVDGRPIIAHVVAMFPGEDEFVFVVNPDHVRTTPLVETLRQLRPRGVIVVEPEHTRAGPVAHTLLAAAHLPDDEPALVCYCDFFMRWDYADFQETVRANGCDGAVIAYKGFHPHLLGPNLYGSLLVDADQWMTAYREKHCFTANKMDCFQSAGAYYFRQGRLLKDYLRRVLSEPENYDGEQFISQAYPLMAADGLRVYVYAVEQFCQWGTPADLEEYLYWSHVFRAVAAEPRTFRYWRRFFDAMDWHPYSIEATRSGGEAPRPAPRRRNGRTPRPRHARANRRAPRA